MSALQIVFTLLFALIWLIALGGHLVLLKVLFTPAERVKLRLPAKSWLILLSITLADLIALLLGLPFTALFEIFDDWYFGSLFCHLAPFVKATAVTVSVYGILALLVQCFELACKSHRPKTEPATLTFLVAVIWMLAVVTAIPLLIAPTVRLHKGPDHEDLELLMFEHDLDETETTEEKSPNETLLERQACYVPYKYSALYSHSYFLEVVIQFTVPIIMVIYLFIKTADAMNRKAVEAKAVRNSRKETSQGEQPQKQQTVQITKHDVIFVRSVLILSVVFHLLRSPTYIFENLIPVQIIDEIWYTYTILSESTYFIKPFLLLAVNSNFRNALRTIGVTTIETNEGANQINFSKLEEEHASP